MGELRELAAGRADLLAHVAGLLEGFSEGQLDEPLARQAAGLCLAAGADTDAIPAWTEEGRRRRAVARMPPMSGGLYGGGRAPALAGLALAHTAVMRLLRKSSSRWARCRALSGM